MIHDAYMVFIFRYAYKVCLVVYNRSLKFLTSFANEFTELSYFFLDGRKIL